MKTRSAAEIVDTIIGTLDQSEHAALGDGMLVAGDEHRDHWGEDVYLVNDHHASGRNEMTMYATVENMEKVSSPDVACYCTKCGNLYSASMADYFMTPRNQALKCHGKRMILVRVMTEVIPL